MIQLNDDNNFGCQLRDGIYKNIQHWSVGGVIHLSLLKDSLNKISIPKEYWADVLEMVNYRKYDRTTDFVEQMLEGLIIRDIVRELIDEELSGNGIRLIKNNNKLK